MRVLQVVPSLDAEQGGIRTSVPAINRALAAVQIEAQCACVGDPEPPVPDFAVLGFKPTAPRLTRASRPLKQWLAENARLFDAIIAHTLWLSPTRYAIDAARAAGKPALLVPHGMLDPDALAHHAWRKRLRWLQGEGQRVRACTLVFSTSADAQRALSDPAVRGLPFGIAPNPVDDQWFKVTRKVATSTARILCLNRWHPRKGVLEFVQALALLRERGVGFSAGLAGNEEDPAYARLVRRHADPLVKAGRLTLHGLCDAAKVRELVAGADILVHPATGYENFGNVIAEAAAVGLAIVASPRALVTPDMAAAGAAITAEPEPNALAEALAQVAQQPGMVRTFGAAARAYAQAHFETARAGKAWCEVLATAGAAGR